MITIPSARGVATRSPMTEEAVVVTVKSSGTFYVTVFATASAADLSSKRVTVLWWDGTKTTQSYDAGYIPEYDTGVSPALTYGVPYSFTKSVSSPYNNSNPKTVRVFTSDASGKAIGYSKNFHTTAISVTDGFLYTDNGVSSIDVSGLRNLKELYVELNSNLTKLTRLPKTLQIIHAGNCNLSNVDVRGLTQLHTLQVYASGLLTSLDVSTCTSLSQLWCQSCNLSSLTLNGLSNLLEVKAYSNPNMTSIRATGVGSAMSTYYPYSSYSIFYAGMNVAGCNLSASALNQLYTDLDTAGGTAYLLVMSQAGSGELSDNPTIATNKGYTVIDTYGGPP